MLVVNSVKFYFLSKIKFCLSFVYVLSKETKHLFIKYNAVKGVKFNKYKQ